MESKLRRKAFISLVVHFMPARDEVTIYLQGKVILNVGLNSNICVVSLGVTVSLFHQTRGDEGEGGHTKHGHETLLAVVAS